MLLHRCHGCFITLEFVVKLVVTFKTKVFFFFNSLVSQIYVIRPSDFGIVSCCFLKQEYGLTSHAGGA